MNVTVLLVNVVLGAGEASGGGKDGVPPGASKVAVTVSACGSVTTQLPLPLQPLPLQLAKVSPPVEVAVSVTVMPSSYVAVQVLPQLIPVGTLVTVPVPVPASVTVRGCVGGVLEEKVAETVADETKVRAQLSVPVQAPPQLENVLPLLGVAVRVTLEPCGNVPEQVLVEQDMPVGLLVTVPPPLIEIDKTESVPVMVVLDTSKLGGLSFPDVSYAVTAK